MKKILLLIFPIISFIVNAQPGFAWAKQMGGAGYDAGYSIIVDNNNNVYTTGYFGGTADFDPGVGSYTLTSAGGHDVFISKLDAAGNFVWAKRMGGWADDKGISITLDKHGNVYTTGYFSDTVDFDPGPGIYNLTSSSYYMPCTFVSKLDPSGNFIWAKQLGGHASPCASAIDNIGNIYVAGSFGGTVDFDPGIGTYDLISAGGNSNFTCKLDSSANFVWAKASGVIDGGIWDIAIDSSYNVYATGTFQGTVDFDPGPGYNLTSAGNYDIFVNKLDVSGNFVWVKQIGGTVGDGGYALAADRIGNIIITGGFMDTVDFDPGPGVHNLISAGVNDIFVMKLDTSGNFLWVKQMGGSSNDAGKAIAVDHSGNIYISGSFRSIGADFDPGPGNYLLNCSGFTDFYLCKLDAKGNFLCAGSMGGIAGTGFNETWSMVINVNNDVYLTGQFATNSCDFDPGPGTYNLSAQSFNIFVCKLTDCLLPTDVYQAFDNHSISVFPNPSSGIFTINLNNETAEAKIFVHDVLGNCVLAKIFMDQNKLEIDLRSQPKGIYFVEIISNGERTMREIVLQ